MDVVSRTPGAPVAKASSRGLLERLLAPFAEVHAGEAGTALLLTLNVFLLLTCYYIIKPVREALILGNEGAEVKSYASAAMVLLLSLYIPAYSAIASRVDRMRLITWVTAFFIGCLGAFYLLARAHMPHLGLVFFIWVGIFNVSIIAQFWSYANDVYTPEAGKRLFAIVAFGSTMGAIAGATITKALIAPLGVKQLMLVAAGVLFVSVVIARIVEAREGARHAQASSEANEQLGSQGGFRLVLGDRYLLLIGLLVLVLNIVNTNGEYILGETLSLLAKHNVEAGLAGAISADDYKQKFIGGFYAGFQLTVNVVAAVVQLFLVSRILRWFGVRAALFFMPLISLAGYSMLAIAPIIGTIRLVKIAENSTDYSLQNTTRQALFLPTSRDAKYKGKAAIDTFFYRSGDLLSAGLVFLGAKLAMTPQRFSAVNVVLVLAWLLIVIQIGRAHARLTAEAERAAAARPVVTT